MSTVDVDIFTHTVDLRSLVLTIKPFIFLCCDEWNDRELDYHPKQVHKRQDGADLVLIRALGRSLTIRGSVEKETQVLGNNSSWLDEPWYLFSQLVFAMNIKQSTGISHSNVVLHPDNQPSKCYRRARITVYH